VASSSGVRGDAAGRRRNGSALCSWTTAARHDETLAMSCIDDQLARSCAHRARDARLAPTPSTVTFAHGFVWMPEAKDGV
jgi:hypothetical protein